MKLMDIYNELENPLDDETTFKRMLEAGITGVHHDLIRNFKTKKTLSFDEMEEYRKERELFFNKCIDDYIKTHPEEKNLDRDQLLEKCIHFQTADNNPSPEFFHVKSRKIDNKTAKEEDFENVRHRFYIDLNYDYLIKFVDLFRDKCIEKNIPYYFKFATANNRTDTIVIYANTYFLGEYYGILKEIEKEHPEFAKNSYDLPILTGKIDGWIGYGAEPPKPTDKNEKKYSFTTYRREPLRLAVTEVTKDVIKRNKDSYVDRKGGKVTFKEYLATKLTKLSLDPTYLSSKKKEFIKDEENVEKISKGILSHMDDIIEQYCTKGSVDSFNAIEEPIKFNISGVDFITVLKEFIPKLVSSKPSIAEEYKNRIKVEFEKKGIDPEKICCDKKIVKNMVEFDESNDAKNMNKDNNAEVKKADATNLYDNIPSEFGMSLEEIEKRISTLNHELDLLKMKKQLLQQKPLDDDGNNTKKPGSM